MRYVATLKIIIIKSTFEQILAKYDQVNNLFLKVFYIVAICLKCRACCDRTRMIMQHGARSVPTFISSFHKIIHICHCFCFFIYGNSLKSWFVFPTLRVCKLWSLLHLYSYKALICNTCISTRSDISTPENSFLHKCTSILHSF